MATNVEKKQPKLKEAPVIADCPNCHSRIITETEYVPGLLTWISVGGLVLFGCVCGCCLVPFCIHELKDVEHYCPSCESTIGTYKRIN